ncbi:MAG TPA: hypothetical protein VKZ63_11625 [Kofleriaceae bacterium]|nr:hypothetical protein [Kofleriaceae bacterium]
MQDSIPRPEKCLIKNLDSGDEVVALFNPKELSIEKSVPWNKHKTSKGDNPVLEFTDAEPKVLSVELLFDGYESRTNVYSKYIKKLESFTLIMGGSNEKKKRPPMCLFMWGKNFPSFMGVIESLATKFTMFLSDGTPVRATCTIKMKQADKLTKADDKKTPMDEYAADGSIATEDDRRRPDRHDDDHRGVLDRSGNDRGEIEPGTPVRGGR